MTVRDWLDEGTALFLDALDGLADEELDASSLLPGWTRGHVLTHIARNADGLRTLLLGAAEGVERKQYRSREARDAAIDAGARRPIKEHLADIEAGHKRFAQTVGLVFTTAAAVAWIGFGAHTVAVVLLSVLVVFALLESVVGFCAGCFVFGHLMRWGIVPEETCAACNDISLRHRPV